MWRRIAFSLVFSLYATNRISLAIVLQRYLSKNVFPRIESATGCCAFARFQNKFEKHRLFACFFSSVIFIIFVSICNNICIVNGFNPNYSYVSSCPLPIGDITNIGVLRIGSFTFPVVYLIVLTLFYNLIFVVGLLIYRLILKINKTIKRRKMDVVDRMLEIIKDN